MTGDKWVEVTVDFGTTPPSCSEIDVSQAKDKGIKWVADRAGFSFTGVTIKEPDGSVASGGDSKEFYNMQTGTEVNASNVTVGWMTIKDKNQDKNEHSYTVNYSGPGNTTGSFDPGIRNQN